MTGRAKRLTSIIGVAALVAVVGTMMVPTASAAPKDKATDFSITITRWLFIDYESAGWEATGAIDDSGYASFIHEPYLVLTSDRGNRSLSVDLHQDGRFTLYGSPGKYKFVGVAGGSYTEEWVQNPNWPVLWTDPLWTVTYVLEGTLGG
jgi:hypothetical protein